MPPQSKSVKNVAAIVGASLDQVEFYKQQLAELEKYATATLEYQPRVDEAVKLLANFDDNVDVATVHEAAELLKTVQYKVSADTAQGLRNQIHKTLESLGTKLSEDLRPDAAASPKF